MNKTRCDWAGNNPLYVDYHDNEWGYPVKDDDKLFEFLILETFQAGLSWITILKKRENRVKNALKVTDRLLTPKELFLGRVSKINSTTAKVLFNG
jgi:hypothetical protein